MKGSKQTSNEAGGRELRTTDEILQLRKKRVQNKYKQMSKSERAKRRQKQRVPSYLSARTGRKRKR